MYTDLLKQVDNYYTGKLQDHGPTATGVDWNSTESQHLRFRQLLNVCRGPRYSLLDYGCGYGALLEYLQTDSTDVAYVGFDISNEMIASAKKVYGARARCTFTSSNLSLTAQDYVVASGIFNVKLQNNADDWKDYIITTIDRLDSLSRKGFAFNMLTSYSDAEYMRTDLYYGDPCFFFDHCKRKFSRHVALLHDYGLYEFTILVRKDLI